MNLGGEEERERERCRKRGDLAEVYVLILCSAKQSHDAEGLAMAVKAI